MVVVYDKALSTLSTSGTHFITCVHYQVIKQMNIISKRIYLTWVMKYIRNRNMMPCSLSIWTSQSYYVKLHDFHTACQCAYINGATVYCDIIHKETFKHLRDEKDHPSVDIGLYIFKSSISSAIQMCPLYSLVRTDFCYGFSLRRDATNIHVCTWI